MDKSEIMRKLMTVDGKVEMAQGHLDMHHTWYSPLKAYQYTQAAHLLLKEIITELFEEGVRPSGG